MLFFKVGGVLRVLGRPSPFEKDSEGKITAPRYASLSLIKKQLNIDFSDDDAYLEALLMTAEQSVENYIQQPLQGLERDGILPYPLLFSILMIAAGLYSNREPVAYSTPHVVPYSVGFLLQPYIKYR